MRRETDTDNVFVKRYTGTISVDAAYSGLQKGTRKEPFRTVTGAVNFAWDGAQLRIAADNYGEVITISKPIRLTAAGGVARIGP